METKFSKDDCADFDHLHDWFIHSVHREDTPVWTDEHIHELLGDFFVFPKEEWEREEYMRGAAKAGSKNTSENIAIGDTVKFGPYKWQVLDVQDGKALLLMDGLLKNPRRYHDKFEPVTWENCSLREWLNKNWLARKFSCREQAAVAAIEPGNSDNPEYGTHGGKSTIDRVFLLSIDEYEKYRDVINSTASWWWLRSPGSTSNGTARVGRDGYLNMRGGNVFWSGGVGGGVRPAMWVGLGGLAAEGVPE